jgi:[Skp1-protein]-hydroxyproline N-acetylglucosaminyltransferase
LYAGGFNFGTAQACIHDVPYDTMGLPYLFFGEELSMAVRFFTHGYDMYAPPESVVYHLWSRNHRPPTSSHKSDDQQSKVHEQKREAQQRVQRQLDGDQSEVGRPNGLGTVRPASEFAALLGVDFNQKGFARDTFDCGLLSEGDFVELPTGVIGSGSETNQTTTTSKEERRKLNSKVSSLDPKAQALIGKFLMGVTR